MSTLDVTLPTTKTPGWGYTNFSRALGGFKTFSPALPAEDATLPAPTHAHTLTFLNGVLLPTATLPAGMILGTTTLPTPLTPALATAHQLIISGQTGDEPLHIRHYFTAAANAVTLPVAGSGLRIELAAGARCTLLESFTSLDDQPIWVCPVLELALAEQAHVHHAVIQTLNRQSFLTLSQTGGLAGQARYHRTLLHSGATLARTESTLTLAKGTDCQLHSLHLTDARQLHDTTATLHFTAPGSTANVRQRNILTGNDQHGGHGVFQGTFRVAQAAQQTDAFMRSETLLLSPAARLDQKPELEIFADDVKCSHGASSAALDENALFYLQARGLDHATAQTLLVGGFARAALENAANAGALPATALAFTEATLDDWLVRQERAA